MSKEEKRVQMFAMIADWQQSGLSKKRYCAEKGINEATFYYWFSRSKENDTSRRGRCDTETRQYYIRGYKLIQFYGWIPGIL